MDAEPPRSAPWYPPRPSAARQRRRKRKGAARVVWPVAGWLVVAVAAVGGVVWSIDEFTVPDVTLDATTAPATTGAAAVPPTKDADATIASTEPAADDQVASEAPVAGTPSTVLALVYPGTVKLTGAVPDRAVVASAVAFVQEWTEFPGFVVDDVLVDQGSWSEPGVRVVDFTGSRFDAGSAALPADVTALDRAAAKLLAMPTTTAVVTGHGDVAGDDTLAMARAQAALDHLVASGVDPSRVTVAAARPDGHGTFDDALVGRLEITFFGVSTTPALVHDPGSET